MNKKIKLSLFVTLLTTSAMAITLPIVSCSASEEIQYIILIGEDHIEQSKEVFKNQLVMANNKEQIEHLLSPQTFGKLLSLREFQLITWTLDFVNQWGDNLSWNDVISSITYRESNYLSYNSETGTYGVFLDPY
ncbi:MAG: hypothetical protein ACRDCF_00515 [Mycoplasmoidaceae bacterium]